MFRKSAAAMALLASVSMVATPALARDRGWGGDWGRHHDRVDAGDVLTGILIIGGIAAIASAASDGNKRARERERQQRDERDYRYERPEQSQDYGRDGQGDARPEWREGGTSTGVGGLNGAVDSCVSEIERGNRHIDGVETVSKQGDGWRVEGRMAGGESFTCAVDGDGRVRSANVGGGASY
jgi:hypothetical protein